MEEKFIPLRSGEVVELDIHDLGHAGEGIGRLRDMVVFVPGALVGEKVSATIIEVKKSFARARLKEIIKKSNYRVEPACSASKRCGGCHLQHLDYNIHLEHKKAVVSAALNRIGSLKNVTVQEVLGMHNPWNYRNKIHLHLWQEGNEIRLGFFEGGSHEPAVDVGQVSCLLVDNKINEIVSTLGVLINKYKVVPYSWQKGKGFLRNIVVRRGMSTGEVMIVFVTTIDHWTSAKQLVNEIIFRHPEVVSVVRNINNSAGRLVLGRENRIMAGKDHISDVLGGLRFQISASSFSQVNPLQTEVLYKKTLELAGLTGTETVVDAYCGIGTIALLLASRAGHVAGVEMVAEAVEDAKKNAILNNISNSEFIAGKVELILPQMLKRGLQPDVVILDPPRQGCDKQVLETIAGTGVPRVIYVSCDPATLARDLSIMEGYNYRTLEVQPVDMFPWTGHVESIIMMTYSGQKDK